MSTSPVYPNKPRLIPGNSTSQTTTTTATTNGHLTSNRIGFKRPLSANNLVQQNLSNGLSYRRRISAMNHNLNSTIKSSISDEQNICHQNGHHHHNGKHSTNGTPPFFFHAIAPAPSPDETNGLSEQTTDKQQSDIGPTSSTTQRIERVLAHSAIKTMVTSDGKSGERISSCSDDDERHRNRAGSVSTGTDEGESDDNQTKIAQQQQQQQLVKIRRQKKTRKTSSTLSQHQTNSTPPSSKTLLRKDESQQQQQQQQLQKRQSSSNDEDNTEPNVGEESSSFGNNSIANNRRNKFMFNAAQAKKNDNFTTTTTDDDGKKHHHHFYHYHALNALEVPNGKTTKTTTTAESNCSSPVPIMNVPATAAPTRKGNRFQIKSIRKSQQQQMLMANAAAAKSSNEDDCSVPTGPSVIPSQPLLIQRKNTNTPTTDGEQSATTENLVVNRPVSARNHTMTNEHHRVRFQVAPHAKHESAAEEEKLPVATTAAITPAPTPAPVSATGEDDEEEEAVAKSPDNRFVKYAKEIGRGAFKTVYRGLDTETSVNVAWCELQDFAQFDKHERARFKEEAEMLKKLQHQNIVGFFDFWEETNPRTNKKVIILVTELMTSGSLKGYIRKFKGQKEDKRINVMKKWCRQILKGLAYLHSRNPPVIHRDLKCDNVFISGTTGCVKIGDLGLATFKTQTFAKSMRGTMEFMAPEMFDEKYDELVDIYSFGLCMLEMITGEYPYGECKFPTAVIRRVTSGLKPDCYYKVENEDVREVIDCCIRTSKEERLPVTELLQHSFFLEDNGLRIDLVRDPSNDSQVIVKNDSIDMKLKIVDKTKRKALWTEHEAIRFLFNLKTDTAEQIADELIAKKYIFDDDKKFVIQAIKDRLRAYKYEQIDRLAGVYSREGKPTINQTSQSSSLVQQPPQPIVAPTQSIPPPAAAAVTATPVPPIPPQVVQQPPVELQPQVIKPTSEILSTPVPVKPAVVSTEPISLTQMSELGNNLPGSVAGSLEVLEAALKKTFNKMNGPTSATTTNPPTSTTSTIVNDNSEPVTPSVVLEESPMARQNTEQQTEDPGLPTAAELSANILQASSTPPILQTQSQPTTMLTSQQQQMLQNIALHLPQPSQSFSHSFIPNTQTQSSSSTTSLINSSLPNEQQTLVTGKSIPPTSSDVSTAENTHLPISPTPTPLTSEIAPPTSVPSDTTTPPVQVQSLGSLQQLEELLKNTFKKPCKTTGTAHSSDGEAANTAVSIPTIPTNEENKGIESDLVVNESSSSTATKMDEMKRKIVDLYHSGGYHPVVSSLIHSSQHPHSQSHPQMPLAQPTPVQPSSASSMMTSQYIQSQSTNTPPQQHIESSHFDPIISGGETNDGPLHELESLLKSTFQKSSSPLPSSAQYSHSTSNDDTLIATPQRMVSNNDMLEIKSMITDLGQTLLAKMNALETKIINHHQQTVQVKEMITETVLPSILDLADIIHQTTAATIDPRVRTRLEQIQTRVRTTQQGMLGPSEHETKNLMEI